MNIRHVSSQIVAGVAAGYLTLGSIALAQTTPVDLLGKVTVQNVVVNRQTSEVTLDLVNSTGQEITAYGGHPL
jgi:hypothetical protein